MTVAIEPAPAPAAPPHQKCSAGEARIALLGHGNVGRAVAHLLATEPGCLGRRLRLEGALVRHAERHRHASCPVVLEASHLLDARPDVLIEVLGGLEPARTIVLEALERGTPVVTANKSLLAAHGDELLEAATRIGTPLHVEAAVIAGVPFLATFARRPLAATATRILGILNGTSNFVLSRVASGVAPGAAISEAQRLGLAEPDPSKDLSGADAAEKLSILIRQFGGLRVPPDQVRTTPLDRLLPSDLDHAREFGGTFKPLAFADFNGDSVSCWVGPALLFDDDPLAHLTGTLNGVRLETGIEQPLCFTGPGAGPRVTARTILDDVAEVLNGAGTVTLRSTAPARIDDETLLGWYVRVCFASNVPERQEVANLFGAHASWIRRWGLDDWRDGNCEQRLLTFACTQHALDAALEALGKLTKCTTERFPVVENGPGIQFPQQVRRSNGVWTSGDLALRPQK